jgi:hypothetical protein
VATLSVHSLRLEGWSVVVLGTCGRDLRCASRHKSLASFYTLQPIQGCIFTAWYSNTVQRRGYNHPHPHAGLRWNLAYEFGLHWLLLATTSQGLVLSPALRAAVAPSAVFTITSLVVFKAKRHVAHARREPHTTPGAWLF